jgi:hypothetical protein
LQDVPFVFSLSETAVWHIPENAAFLCDKAAVLGDMIIGISTSYKHVGCPIVYKYNTRLSYT